MQDVTGVHTVSVVTVHDWVTYDFPSWHCVQFVQILLLVLLHGDISKVPCPHCLHCEHCMSDTFVHAFVKYVSGGHEVLHCEHTLSFVLLHADLR